MTPAEDAVNRITAPIDDVLAKVVAAVGRLEAQKRDREIGLLREIASRAESDPAFRAAVVMLIVD